MDFLDDVAKAEVKNVPVGGIFVGAVGAALTRQLGKMLDSYLSRKVDWWLNKFPDPITRYAIADSIVGAALAGVMPQFKGVLGEAFTKVFAIGSAGYAGSDWLDLLVEKAKTAAVTGAPAGRGAGEEEGTAAPPTPTGPTVTAKGEAAQAAARIAGKAA